MDEKTVRALNAINRSFYDEMAASFSATRRDPWPGWTQLPALVRRHLAGRELHVLDVGCGNGRFGAYLAEALPEARPSLHYYGLDASEPLLERLRARALPFASVATQRTDVALAPFPDAFPEQRFSLIAVFGLLHHIPGERNRLALMRALVDLLEPGGLLALAVWRFHDFERFRARLRPWAEYNAGAAEPIVEAELEAGDHLLPWGEDGRAVRYCHFVAAPELVRTLDALPVEVLADYDADGREGRFNRYCVLRARGALSIRRQLQGAAAIESALVNGEPLQRIVVSREAEDAGTAALIRHATSAGVPVQRVTARVFRRLQAGDDRSHALALAGPAPGATEDEVLRGDGATWQLVGVAYPGNAGMALRTAEVSGAAGAFIAADFDRSARRNTLRADRYMPVFFGHAETTLSAAALAGRRILAVETGSDSAPWQVDLTGRCHFVVGGEAQGIPAAILQRCEAVLSLPMPGFVPSYSLQAAVAAVAAVRLRQLAETAP